MPAKRLFVSTAVMAFAAAASVPAIAQSTDSGGASRFQQGYGGARTAANTAATGYTRDANGNRLIGHMLDVRITSALPHSLRGEVVVS